MEQERFSFVFFNVKVGLNSQRARISSSILISDEYSSEMTTSI